MSNYLEIVNINDISRIFKAERERQGLSIPELAKMVGCTVRVVYYWETGARVPTLPTITAWADALGFDGVLLKTYGYMKGRR